VSIDELVHNSEAMLAQFVGFDTTSSRSNLVMIDAMDAQLKTLGARTRRFLSPDGTKANLFASIGPNVPGGVVLSGHTDVVPCDGQPWTTDPFNLTLKSGRLYGRGTADMKAFIACAMAAAPTFTAIDLRRPVHFAWSYDEEVGCTGTPAMIQGIAGDLPAPSGVIVGEPTGMKIVSAHKGVQVTQVRVIGHAAHSSLTHLGISANMIAARLMAKLVEIQEGLVLAVDPASPFEPRHATLTIGQIHGGTAVNILAPECNFVFDLRVTPDLSADQVLAPFYDLATRLSAQMRELFPESGVEWAVTAAVPAFMPEVDGAAAALARRLTGDNHEMRAVPFGSEAGQFQQAGFSTVICGPGSIEQAHQPNEYIERDQIAVCAQSMLRLAEILSST